MHGLKKVGEALGEFNVFEPIKVHEPEAPGMQDYNGAPIPYIPVAGLTKGMATAGLDEKLKALIRSAWIRAKPTDGATRGSVLAGTHRVAPGMPPLPGVPGAMPPLPHTPGQRPVPGMVNQYNAAAPVGFQKPLMHHEAEAKLRYLMGEVPKDFALMQTLPVISAYAFRGDTRGPQDIRKANGFQPPISRTDQHYLYNTILPTFNAWLKVKLGIELSKDEFNDLLTQAMPDKNDRVIFSYYEMWRSQVASESMHIGRMLANETLKGYVSTTRAPTVAKGFAKEGGHVYYLKVRTGFLIPSKGTHPWTHIFGEEEIASPNPVEWDDVMGFRAVGRGKRFDGPIFMRMGLNGRDSNAFEKGIRALSGKHRI